MFTKGKWELSEIQPWEIWVGADKHIASVHGQQEARSANAQRICVAVNNFDEMYALIKQLEGCVEEARELLKIDNPESVFLEDWERMLKRADRLKQALANAERKV